MSRTQIVNWFDRPIVGTLLTITVFLIGGLYGYGRLSGSVDMIRQQVSEIVPHVYQTEGAVNAMLREHHATAADAANSPTPPRRPLSPIADAK